MQLDPKIIRSSFELAKPIANQVADKFYEILWGTYPASKALFVNVDMARQKQALIGSLVYIVDHIEDEAALMKYLKDMGARHINYGAEFPHYEMVGDSLLKTFEFFFKEKWTPELKGQWTLAYGVIAQVMKQGATEAAGSQKQAA